MCYTAQDAIIKSILVVLQLQQYYKSSSLRFNVLRGFGYRKTVSKNRTKFLQNMSSYCSPLVEIKSKPSSDSDYQ